jgi:hypothetical protein
MQYLLTEEEYKHLDAKYKEEAKEERIKMLKRLEGVFLKHQISFIDTLENSILLTIINDIKKAMEPTPPSPH